MGPAVPVASVASAADGAADGAQGADSDDASRAGGFMHFVTVAVVVGYTAVALLLLGMVLAATYAHSPVDGEICTFLLLFWLACGAAAAWCTFAHRRAGDGSQKGLGRDQDEGVVSPGSATPLLS